MADSLLGWLGGGLYGQVNQSQGAPTIDTDQVQQQMALAQKARQGQQGAIDLTNKMALGRGPSAADALLKEQTLRSEANNNALASSGSGSIGQGEARRSAIMANQATDSAAGGQAAVSRAVEQMGAINSLGQQTTAQRAGDISGAGLEGNLAVAGSNLQMDTQKLNEQASAQNQNSNQSFLQNVAGAGAGIAALFSDPDAKYGIAPADEETHPFVAEVRGKHAHLYQDSGYTGLNEGPMSVSSPPQAKQAVASADDGPNAGQVIGAGLKGFSDPGSVGVGKSDSKQSSPQAATKGAATNGPVSNVSPYVSDTFENAKEKVNAPGNMYADPGQGQVMAPLPKYLEDYISGVGNEQTLSSPPEAKQEIRPASASMTVPGEGTAGRIEDQYPIARDPYVAAMLTGGHSYSDPEDKFRMVPMPTREQQEQGPGEYRYVGPGDQVLTYFPKQEQMETPGDKGWNRPDLVHMYDDLPQGSLTETEMFPSMQPRASHHLKMKGPQRLDVDEETITAEPPAASKEKHGLPISLSSPPQAKRGVQAGNVGNALRNLNPYSFQYKNPGNEPISNPRGGERFFGVMTTDLKKNPITRNMVENRGQGALEKVSVPAATSFNLAGEAHLQKRSDDHEARLGALEKIMRSAAAKKGRRMK